MSLRWRLGAYLAALHLGVFVLALVYLRTHLPVFLAVELTLVISFVLGLRLVRSALRPLEYTARFRDLLEDKDYATRLVRSDAPELNALVSQFNAMLAALYQERLALGEQRGFLDSLLQATPSAVIAFDFEGRITLMNPSARALLGVDNPMGKALSHWDAQPLAADLDALPLNDSRLLSTADGRRFLAQRRQFHDRGFARDFLLVDEMTDVLESSERATYDKLVRVLAHEVNNTVAATGSVLDSLLFYQSQLDARDADDFSTAIVAVKRRNVSLGEFIERFTRVVKMPAPERRPVSLAAMLDDILWLNRESCSSRGITIGWRQREELPLLPLDRQLMEQALINIVKNAIEAVEAVPGGHVQFELARDGARLRLAVCDSANSLGSLPARELFTPFVSTKKGGQGIGLMLVREVLQRHQLDFRLASETGETRFEIWFPA